ncbi:DNA polymerase III subunit delta [Loigolactobacillus jiayinensis]|uniref:DNA polymerase III subunit delta n=1 Tax=Loigolactobacillus jiayinensis TaxID=2486016 RepID=A0ABW1RE46_9LACO|nr:DNA polymerase III subunit delta [Loigolactobacillus jiayinensis]
MDVPTLLKELKQQKLHSIYLVKGTEGYLIDQVKAQFQALLTPDEMTMNFGNYDLATTPLATALDDAMSAPFFGERRLVFVQNPIFLTAESKQAKIVHDVESFLTYLNDPPQTTILVIFAAYDKLDERKKVTKTLKKQSTLIDVAPLSEAQAQQYVRSYLKEQQVSIEPAALRLLVARTEANLSLMMAELTKLTLYAMHERQITVAAVEQLVTPSLEQNVFTLVDAVMARDVARGATLYQQLVLQKEEPLKLNAILVGQFRLLLQVKILQRNGYSQGELAKVLRVHPYRIKLAINQAKKFPQTALRQAYLGLIDLEYKLKTSQQAPELLFQLFILQFSQGAA